MQTRKLELACPACNSNEVFYTCTPNCCFNHVCNSCGSTFELTTRFTGEVLNGVIPPTPLPEATDPTVACSRCESISVFMVRESELVCAQCGSLLELEFTAVAANI